VKGLTYYNRMKKHPFDMETIQREASQWRVCSGQWKDGGHVVDLHRLKLGLMGHPGGDHFMMEQCSEGSAEEALRFLHERGYECSLLATGGGFSVCNLRKKAH